MEPLKPQDLGEETPLDLKTRRKSLNRIMRQASVMDTQRASDGSMKMTYWF